MNAAISGLMLSLILANAVVAATAPAPLPAIQAPTGFDNRSNGAADEAAHQSDLAKFGKQEQEALFEFLALPVTVIKP